MNFTGQYFLKTTRLGFRFWRKNDLDLALNLWGDPMVTRLIDARGTLTQEQVKKRLQVEITTENEYGVQYWPIFLLKTDEHIGCCGLRPYDLPKKIYEIGVHICSTHWRMGYALEAVQGVIDYALNVRKAKGLFAGHHPKNDSSHRLLKKLGFEYTHAEFYPPTGLHHPSYQLNLKHHD